MFQTKLNEVIEFATASDFSQELYQAKKDYGNRVGEFYEDDQSYHNRMSHFLEWYIFDRNLKGKEFTPLLEYIEIHKKYWSEETFQGFMNLVLNIHGIFQIKKISKNYVLVVNLFDRNKYKVFEDDSDLIFQKNDLFEGRIITDKTGNRFTGNYCFHPSETQRFIQSEIGKLIQNAKENTYKLKKLEIVKSRMERQINKQGLKIQKYHRKIENIKGETFRKRLIVKKQDIEKQKNILIDRISKLNDEITNIKTIKNELEGQQSKSQLMHKFAHMNLQWERSRQIDLKDIYRN